MIYEPELICPHPSPTVEHILSTYQSIWMIYNTEVLQRIIYVISNSKEGQISPANVSGGLGWLFAMIVDSLVG